MKITGYILLIVILFCQDVSLKHHRELAKSLDSVGSHRIQASSPYLSYKVQQRPSRNVANTRSQEGAVKYLLKHQVEQTHYDLVDPLFLLQNLVMLQTKGSQIQAILDDDEQFTAISNQVFEEFDGEGNGVIDKYELYIVLKKLAIDTETPIPTYEEVEGKLEELDTDQNGVINKEEFKVLAEQMLRVTMGE